MIDVQQITKRYGQHTAIDRVTFSVAKGEVLAFLGPNGAGKTTTMRILTCFMPATEGTARVAGFDCAAQPMEVKRRIGYLPETPPVYQELTVMEYLTFVGRLRGMTGPNLTSALDQSISRLELGAVRHRLIGNLSRGYRQRVGLAQALLHDPPVLILDEPTVGLDPKQIIEIRELIKSLAGSHTVILSTHILPEATAVCQRVVIISGGRIVAVDTPLHLAQDVGGGNERVQVIVRGPRDNIMSALAALPNVESATPQPTLGDLPGVTTFEVVSSPQSDLRPRLAQAIVGNNWELLELRSVSMSLEDVFLRVTSAEEPMQEPDEADVYVEGEDQAYEEQEIAYEEVADEAAAEAEAEATAAAAAEAAQSGPAQGRGRKGGRK